MKLYKDIDLLPAWNYFKIIDTGDLRYLLFLSDYNELPNSKKVGENIIKKGLFKKQREAIYNFINKDLVKAWEKINHQLPDDSINLDELRLNVKMWQSYRNWLATGKKKDENEYHGAFAKYKKSVFKNYNESLSITQQAVRYIMQEGCDMPLCIKFGLLYMDSEFRDFDTLYNDMKNKKEIGFYNVLKIRAYLVEYFSKMRNSSSDENLMDEVVSIESILGFSINLKEISIKKYFAYRSKAISISKQMEKNG